VTAATPEHPASEEAPEVYRRWLRVDQPENWDGPSDGLIDELWREKSGEHKEFWRSLDAARRAVATQSQPAPFSDDVHVDWHMTPGEWRQLYTALWEHAGDTPYIGRLIEAGKIPRPFGRPQAAGQSQPAPGADDQQRHIDQLHNLIRDMLQSFPDTADEPQWRDRAGELHVCDPDGQPYRAITEEDL
jgi:hypothetical protein